MLSVLFYCLAVLVVLVLYFFFNPEENNDSSSNSLRQNLSAYRVPAWYSASSKLASTQSSPKDECKSISGKSLSRIKRWDSKSSVLTMISEHSVATTKSLCSMHVNYESHYYFRNRIKRLYCKLTQVYLPTVYKYLGLGDDNVETGHKNNSSISDHYTNFDELVLELNRLDFVYPIISELGSTDDSRFCFNVIIGIDFTASNEWKGRKTFNSQSLHKTLGNRIYNPYQKVISILGIALHKLVTTALNQKNRVATAASAFDDSFSLQNIQQCLANANSTSPFRIYCYGFGDASTQDESVFPFFNPFAHSHSSTNCSDDSNSILGNNGYITVDSFDDVLNRYTEISKNVNLSGPTSFAPIIFKAIEIMKQKQLSEYMACTQLDSISIMDENLASTLDEAHLAYHILFIIADGKVSEENEAETVRAIVEASNYPLSIIMIGVGDGPWDTMIKFDDYVCEKSKFDNFQFVDYHQIVKNSKSPDVSFALEALMEIPAQYRIMKKLNYI